MKNLIVKFVTIGSQVSYVLDSAVDKNKMEFDLSSKTEQNEASKILKGIACFIDEHWSDEQKESFDNIQKFERDYVLVHYNQFDAVVIECYS